jgi:general secretion pathway protein B
MAAPPAAPSTSAPAAQPIPAQTVTGLPPDAPKLTISGGIYSTNPTQRMLIVNGQVFNEGSEVAPGVALDEIKPRTAVLRFRGARYSVTY